MANSKQSSVRRLKMSERAEELRKVHFPGVPIEWLWHRKQNDGFSTVPRTLPIVMQAIDDQSKGQPAGHVLFCLWARAPDHPVIQIENPGTFAAEAGFTGPRAVDTWRRRMKRLHELGFIMTKPGPSGDYHHVLLLNPNAAVEWMRMKAWVQDGLYGRFLGRLADVGAYGDLERIRKYWAAQQQADAAAAAASATGSEVAISTSEPSSRAT
ncbi:hypothetical protein J7373_11035 [Xanthomonas sp. A2111]|uniref:Uncharacterized protein n=1 Tax=Xanthomonas hawaiiensis TaxID=3003247 RepID=A0ABU2I1J7_9XANT|nr:hypothetical protein [Xanthomonas sp. A2111]MBO9828782.1 hypothetical protein [Xanthomonas sp. A2111]MDS9992025.1 hypothetical protein [Xanthomonas sp. A2111]